MAMASGPGVHVECTAVTPEQRQARKIEDDRYARGYDVSPHRSGPWWTSEQYAALPPNHSEPAACSVPCCPRCRVRGNQGQPLATTDICYSCRRCGLRISFDGLHGWAGGDEWHMIEVFV